MAEQFLLFVVSLVVACGTKPRGLYDKPWTFCQNSLASFQGMSGQVAHAWLFRFFKFKIILWDLSFLGQPKTEEMNSPDSWVVSTITTFSSKMKISKVVITDPTKPVTYNEFSFEVKCSFIFFPGLLLFLRRLLLTFRLVLTFA